MYLPEAALHIPDVILLGRGTWPPNSLQDWALQKTPNLLARQDGGQLIPVVL